MNKFENLKIGYPDKSNTDLAKVVSLWTGVEPKMLAKSFSDVHDMFGYGHSVVAFNSSYGTDEPVGHAGLTFKWPDDWNEVGAVVTDKDFRGRGIGRRAVLALLKNLKFMYPDEKYFALANEYSARLFESIGGVKMSTQELPEAVWRACVECPVKPLQKPGEVIMCCDTPYNLTNVKVDHVEDVKSPKPINRIKRPGYGDRGEMFDRNGYSMWGR